MRSSCFLVACFANWIWSCFVTTSSVFYLLRMFLYWFHYAFWLAQPLQKHIINLAWWQGSGGTILKNVDETKFKSININIFTRLSKFSTLQPEFHLSQRWRSSYLCSQRGADHWAPSFAHAPDIAPTATTTPAQSHIPGLLCLSIGHGRGEFSGSWENRRARVCDSPASYHGMLPKLLSPLPGNV